MKRYLLLLIAVVLCAASCTTTRYISMQPSLEAEWVGRSHADIIRGFGAPTREVSDGDDGLILVYEETYSTHETEHSGSTVTTTSRDYRTFKEFSLDAAGTCYNVRTNEQMEDGEEFNLGGTIITSLFGTACLFILIMAASM
jgi:hypothetical protein